MKRESNFKIFATFIFMFAILTVFGGLLCNKKIYAMEISNNEVTTFGEDGVVNMIYPTDHKYETGESIISNKETLLKAVKALYFYRTTEIGDITVSDPSVLKIDKNGGIEAGDAGLAYINIPIKENESYKQFNLRWYYLIYPANTTGCKISLNKKGKFRYGTYIGINQMKCYAGKNTKGIVELASDKNFKHIVKSWDNISSKTLNNKDYFITIKNIKKLKLKDKKNYYIRCYCYKKFNNFTLYSNKCSPQKIKFKKGKMKLNDVFDNFVPSVENLSKEEIFKKSGLNITDSIDYMTFERLYVKPSVSVTNP